MKNNLRKNIYTHIYMYIYIYIYIRLKKSSFGFFHTILQKNPNELFGQPNIITESFAVQWKLKTTL